MRDHAVQLVLDRHALGAAQEPNWSPYRDMATAVQGLQANNKLE